MKVLQKDSKGREVKAWQGFLLEKGYDYVGKADGDFGKNTLKATTAFQSDNGLTADGTVNEETLNKAIELGFEVPEEVIGAALTSEQLKAIMPFATSENRDKFLDPLNIVMAKYEINTPLRQAHFLAQIAHESGSLKYSEEIASGKAYEGRSNLGNTQPGDGVRFKGRGLMQLTGRANYESYGDYLGIDLTEEPSQVATNPELCVGVAGWFWMKNNLNNLADDDDVRAVTKRINGGYNGLDDRISFLQKAKKALDI